MDNLNCVCVHLINMNIFSMAATKYLHKRFADIFNKTNIDDLFCILSNIEVNNFEKRA